MSAETDAARGRYDAAMARVEVVKQSDSARAERMQTRASARLARDLKAAGDRTSRQVRLAEARAAALRRHPDADPAAVRGTTAKAIQQSAARSAEYMRNQTSAAVRREREGADSVERERARGVLGRLARDARTLRGEPREQALLANPLSGNEEATLAEMRRAGRLAPLFGNRPTPKSPGAPKRRGA